MSAYCEIALPVPLDHTFTYGVRLGQQPKRGSRVIAPFRNEKLIGVVTAVDAAAPPADVEIRYLEAVLDEEPLLSDHLLELAEWTAQYYLAPLGEVLRAMLPLTAEVKRTVYYRLTDLGRDVLAKAMEAEGDSIGDEERNAGPSTRSLREPAQDDIFGRRASRRRGRVSREAQDMERRVLERLKSGEPVKVSTLRTATAATLPVLAAMVRKKWIARETAAAERDARRMERFAVLIPEGRLPSLTEKQQAILAELAASGGELPLAEVRKRGLPSSTLQTLVRRELVRIEERPEAFRLGGLTPATEQIYLNLAQIDALASLTNALGAFHAFLLFGVTGSGKTAVYLAAMQKALERGLASILLVPEIGLTPQMAGLLDQEFGKKVALLHS
ncbi:MAG: DEAD/DEAH box helicase family protein, partial [Terracidiphilus sp.]